MHRFALLAIASAGCFAPEEHHDISYDDRFDAAKLDIYEAEPGIAHPTVMFIHGGSWRFGDKSVFEVAGRRLARSGFTVASIDYRLLPEGVFPNNIQDCLCALAFLRAHADDYAIDPDRIAVMGYSAGAHLAGLVGVAANRPELAPDCDAAAGQPLALPAATISSSGPQDMRAFYREADSDSVAEIFGGTPDELPEAYDLGSPRFHVRPDLPPYLILLDLIDVGGMYDMRDALAAAGDDVRLLQLAGSLHILEQHDDPGIYDGGVESETPEAWIAIEDFLFRTIASPQRSASLRAPAEPGLSIGAAR